MIEKSTTQGLDGNDWAVLATILLVSGAGTIAVRTRYGVASVARSTFAASPGHARRASFLIRGRSSTPG